MDPKLVRVVYIFEFLLALIALFTFWSQVGGQTHLDLMAWYFKLFFGIAIPYAVVRATAAAIHHERAWNPTALRWLAVIAVLAAIAGVLTYYYHLYEPTDEDEDQPSTQTSIKPVNCSRATLL